MFVDAIVKTEHLPFREFSTPFIDKKGAIYKIKDKFSNKKRQFLGKNKGNT